MLFKIAAMWAQRFIPRVLNKLFCVAWCLMKLYDSAPSCCYRLTLSRRECRCESTSGCIWWSGSPAAVVKAVAMNSDFM